MWAKFKHAAELRLPLKEAFDSTPESDYGPSRGCQRSEVRGFQDLDILPD